MAGFTRLGANLTQAIFNNVLDALELWAARSGKGVLSGLELSPGSGLEVAISAGSLLGLKAKGFDAQTFDLTASQTRYVWIDEDGNLTTTTDPEDPGGTAVCLGLVTTDADSVTVITSAGRMETARWVSRVFRIGPGTLEVDPDAYAVRVNASLEVVGHILRPTRRHDLDADLELPASFPNVIRVTPDASGRKVILPEEPDISLDFEIINDGDEDVLLRDPTDASTISTIEPGQRAIVRPTVSAGEVVWPASITAE